MIRECERNSIIIVDDDRSMCALYREMLSIFGYDALTYYTYRDGVKGFQDNFSLVGGVIVDYNLKEVRTGLDVARSIKRKMPCIPIFMLTGTDREDMEKGVTLDTEVDIYKNKPIGIDILETVVLSFASLREKNSINLGGCGSGCCRCLYDLSESSVA